MLRLSRWSVNYESSEFISYDLIFQIYETYEVDTIVVAGLMNTRMIMTMEGMLVDVVKKVEGMVVEVIKNKEGIVGVVVKKVDGMVVEVDKKVEGIVVDFNKKQVLMM